MKIFTLTLSGRYAYFLNQRKYLAKDRMFLVAINKSYATASEDQAERYLRLIRQENKAPVHIEGYSRSIAHARE